MALFPNDRKAGKHSLADDAKAVENDGKRVAHRVTKDLERAETLASMLAHSRASRTVEVADMLAGMYIYEWENLSKFWEQQAEVETFLQQICRISPQRWHHWIEFYDQHRHAKEPRKIWRLPQGLRPAKGKAAQPNGVPLLRSAELQNVLKTAEELSPARDFVDGRAIPILTCECVLLAIAKKTDSEIGHRLVATGLNVTSLEESARNPKHAPKH
ncbi:MAG: hypothetical protein WCD49_04670 [Candidatus Acidiferrales bacterium]